MMAGGPGRAAAWSCVLLLLASCGGGGGDDAATARQPSQQPSVREKPAALAAPAQARWSAPAPLSLVPVGAANTPNGQVLMWSADDRFNFNVTTTKRTWFVELDPQTGVSTEREVTETAHNMFCPGTTNLTDGSLLINGGISEAETSIWNAATRQWSIAAPMGIKRGYNANTILPDGSVLTLGGSWSGGLGLKHGERWTRDGGWQRLSGVRVDGGVAPDPAGVYRGDNHMWLIPAPNGRVLQAGPSANMSWIDPTGAGSVRTAGMRGDDVYSQSGNAVMYDIGKILKVGGSTAYSGAAATRGAYVIDVNGELSVRKVTPMAYARIFSNAVVLPNGQVLVVGGQTVGQPFSDNNSVLVPELWNPATETFTPLPPVSSGRNYHSVGLLLPDGRVLSGGGGLCGTGCAGNHADYQILTPPYLLNDDGTPTTRPAITAAPTKATHGTTFTVNTNGAVTAFALVRLSSTTHTVNNDQRRIPLTFTAQSSTTYRVTLPTNPGIMLPGQYMLFALDARGVPSVSSLVQIDGTAAPKLANPGDQAHLLGNAVSLPIQATAAAGTLRFSAAGLPEGLSIDASTGRITGLPLRTGRSVVTITASDDNATTSTVLLWDIAVAGSIRYIKLEALSAIGGGTNAVVAEFNVLDGSGNLMPRIGWRATADSEELIGYAGKAETTILALDGNPGSFWQTQWQGGNPAMPHQLTVDLGTLARPSAIRYLPRQSDTRGRIAQFRVYVSANGTDWSAPLATGDFSTMGGANDAKTVPITLPTAGGLPPAMLVPAPVSVSEGQAVSVRVAAIDPLGGALVYSATGLPAGVGIDPASGLISGTPTVAGSYSVLVKATSTQGGSSTVTLVLTIAGAGVSNLAVDLAPAYVGGDATIAASAIGAGLRYAFDFGDGSVVVPFGTAASAQHRYAEPGVYRVTVYARSFDGPISSRTVLQAVANPPLAGRAQASSLMAVEPRGGAPRLWVANPDGDTVGVFDARTLAKLAEVPVGTGPRAVALVSADRAWVVNRDSASLSLIDTTSFAVVQTVALRRGSQPYGIVASPAGGPVWVTLGAAGQLLRLDRAGATTGALVVGPEPRQLAMTPDGSKLLVSRFITPPLPGEAGAAPQTVLNGQAVGGEVVIVDAASFAITGTTVLRHSERADSTTQGRGVPNYLGAAAVAPDGRSAWVPSKQDNIKRGPRRDGLALDFQNTVRAISSRIDLPAATEDSAGRIDHDNASLASAAAFHPSGAYLFVALETSREVAVVDPVARQELFRVTAGRAPQGVTVSDDGQRLFVANYMDRSVSVFDLAPLVNNGEQRLPLTATLAPMATEKLSATVLKGKQHFYDARDPRLARDSYMSCASCHRDGGHDGRVWDLSAQGEGLRNTTSLRGRAGAHGRLHWSGNFDEVQDFEGQIRSLAQGTGLMRDADFNAGTRSQPLGDRKTGLSADLDALAAFVASLDQADPSPLRPSATTLSTAATEGRAVFVRENCAACHAGAAFTGSASATLLDVGTVKATSGTRLGAPLTGIDPPTLRDVWATAPYLHDGSAPTLEAAVKAHKGSLLGTADLARVAAYLREIGGDEGPAPRPAGVGGGLKGTYFANKTLTGTAAITRYEGVNFLFDYASPGTGVPVDNFSARWTGWVVAPATGSYRLQTESDDGVRVWVNGTLLIDNWTPHARMLDTSGVLNFVAGRAYEIRVDYFESVGRATMRLLWQTPGMSVFEPVPAKDLWAAVPTNGTGLSPSYFAGISLGGAAFTRAPEAVNFDWGTGAPMAGLPVDYFSARWQGSLVVPTTGNYAFSTVSNDGVRLWIDGRLVIDQWNDHATMSHYTASMAFTAGQRVSVRMEYYERSGSAAARLRWWVPGATAHTVVPANRLFPS